MSLFRILRKQQHADEPKRNTIDTEPTRQQHAAAVAVSKVIKDDAGGCAGGWEVVGRPAKTENVGDDDDDRKSTPAAHDTRTRS